MHNLTVVQRASGFSFLATFWLLCWFLLAPPCARAFNGAASRTIVINQIYGGGGNSGATYTNDFVELLNISSTPIDISAWSLQYQSSAGSTWTVVNLCSSTTVGTCVIQPGHYYLIQLASQAAVGASLPTPDISNTSLNISAAQGKIALVNSRTALPTTSGGNCTSVLAITGAPAVIDFVGYGTNTNVCSETSPAPTTSNNTQALARTTAQDTDNNATDFSVISPPNPRNSSSTPISPTAASLTVSGRIVTKDGAPLGGVAVRLSGARTGVTVTRSDGAYRFDYLQTGGFYIITPQLPGYEFTPSVRAFALASDTTDAVFAAEANANAKANAIDATEFFVRQQYLDFLNREPDAEGFDFWTNQIASCGNDAACLDAQRQNVSAAYFLSTEFQETGFFVIRAQRVALGKRSDDAASRLSYQTFVRDWQTVGAGVQIGRADAALRLEQNKLAYARALVASDEFIAAFPSALTASEFVAALCRRAGVSLTAQERQAAIAAYGAGDAVGRAQSLLTIVDTETVRSAEFAASFVLMQYFGYLRRNPTDAPDDSDVGYQFWLKKLNDAGGDYARAQMVRSFLISQEYRQRFGAP